MPPRKAAAKAAAPAVEPTDTASDDFTEYDAKKKAKKAKNDQAEPVATVKAKKGKGKKKAKAAPDPNAVLRHLHTLLDVVTDRLVNKHEGASHDQRMAEAWDDFHQAASAALDSE